MATSGPHIHTDTKYVYRASLGQAHCWAQDRPHLSRSLGPVGRARHVMDVQETGGHKQESSFRAGPIDCPLLRGRSLHACLGFIPISTSYTPAPLLPTAVRSPQSGGSHRKPRSSAAKVPDPALVLRTATCHCWRCPFSSFSRPLALNLPFFPLPQRN